MAEPESTQDLDRPGAAAGAAQAPSGPRVRFTRDGAIAILRLDAPPVNALGGRLRRALDAALDAALAQDGTEALVIAAEGRWFSAGSDLREFDPAVPPDPSGTPTLAQICARIEAADLPVIAVLQGNALGGGAELALAAHYRLAAPDSRLGLPEVHLGLIPLAGSIQRLARLAGIPAACDLLLGGRPLAAEAAEARGLVDGIPQGDPVAAGLGLARALLSRGAGARPAQEGTAHRTDPAAAFAHLAERRATATGPAAPRILDCLEAALVLPWEAALAFEESAAEDCLADPVSRALRHLFLAETRLPATLGARGEGGRLKLTADGVGLANRLAVALFRAAQALVRGGATQAEVDGALVGAGFVEGPFGGRTPRPAPRQERRLVAAVLAEGGRMLAEGAVTRASDVDVLAVAGATWPRSLGGPMQRATALGLPGLVRDMRGWAAEDALWSVPEPVLQASRVAAGFAALGPAA